MKDAWHDLSDGSQVKILQVTFGLRHMMSNEPTRFTSTTTSLMFWMSRRSQNRNSGLFSVLSGWTTDVRGQTSHLFLRSNHSFGGNIPNPQLYVFELAPPSDNQPFTLSVTIVDNSRGASSHSVEWFLPNSTEWLSEIVKHQSKYVRSHQYLRDELACAIGHHDHSTAIDLITHGARLDDPNMIGWRDIDYAVSEQNLPLVKLLIHSGASLKPGFKGQFPLMHRAVAQNNKPLVKLLLANGADPLEVDCFGKTARQRAKKEGFRSIVKLLARD